MSVKWNESKENIRPSSRSRNIQTLNQENENDFKEKINEQIQNYEKQLESYNGDDVLSIWVKYIKWAEQINIKNTIKEFKLTSLYQRSLDQCKRIDKYLHDERFVNLLIDFNKIKTIPNENNDGPVPVHSDANVRPKKMNTVDYNREKELLATNMCINDGNPPYKKKLQFIYKLVKPDENVENEFSFEELRAMQYYLIYNERRKTNQAEKALNELQKQLAESKVKQNNAKTTQSACTSTQMSECGTNTTVSLKGLSGSSTFGTSKFSSSSNLSKFACTTHRNDRTDYDNFTNVSLMSMTNNKKYDDNDASAVDDTLTVDDNTRPYMCTTIQTSRNFTIHTKKACRDVDALFGTSSTTDISSSNTTAGVTLSQQTRTDSDESGSGLSQRTNDFTIFKQPKIQESDKNGSIFVYQQSQVYDENADRNDELKKPLRMPLQSIEIPIMEEKPKKSQNATYDFNEDDDDVFDLPTSSKFAPFNDQNTEKSIFNPEMMSTRALKSTAHFDKTSLIKDLTISMQGSPEKQRHEVMDETRKNEENSNKKSLSQSLFATLPCIREGSNDTKHIGANTLAWDSGFDFLIKSMSIETKDTPQQQKFTVNKISDAESAQEISYSVKTTNYKEQYYQMVEVSGLTNSTIPMGSDVTLPLLVQNNDLTQSIAHQKMPDITMKINEFSQINADDISKMQVLERTQMTQHSMMQMRQHETLSVMCTSQADLSMPKAPDFSFDKSVQLPSDTNNSVEKKQENEEGTELLTAKEFDETMTHNYRVMSTTCLNTSKLDLDSPFALAALTTCGNIMNAMQNRSILTGDFQTNTMQGFAGFTGHINTDFTTTNKLDLTLMNAISDPFNSDLKNRLLSKRTAFFANRKNYIDLEGTSDLPNITVNKIISAILPDMKPYKIIGEIGCGAYAKIYLIKANNDKKAKDTALKVSKQACPWEFYVTETIHERLKALTTSINLENSFIQMAQFAKFNNGSICEMKYYKNGTLLDLINFHVKTQQSMPYWFVLYLTIEILSIINYLHKCKIIHGDIKPDNVIVNELPTNLSYFDQTKTKCLVLIDFNRSIDLDLYPDTVEFDAKTDNKSLLSPEMKTDKTWTYQIDYFGVLSSMHCIIFKKYLNTYEQNGQFRLTTSMPRSYDRLFARFFDTFLNIPSCKELPNLELEWIPAFVELFKKEIMNFPKSSKYVKDLTQYFDNSNNIGTSGKITL